MNLTIVGLAIAIAGPAQPARDHAGPSEVSWPSDRDAPEVEVAKTADAPKAKPKKKGGSVPPPRLVGQRERIRVAVGLSPEAPGSKGEKKLVDSLERGAVQSRNPTAEVRRTRPGTASPRQICREKRDDLVMQIGYIADREGPVVVSHDCRLDRSLSPRQAKAAADPGLVAALWDEHDDLVRAGVKERRRLGRLGPRARVGIAAGVALVVVGVAVGLLVANALRDETVVLRVSP